MQTALGRQLGEDEELYCILDFDYGEEHERASIG